MKPKLLIVDDDPGIRNQLRWALLEDYEVFLAEDGAGAIAAFRQQQPGVVLLDLGLPPQPDRPEEGLAALAEMNSLNRFARIIIATGQGEKVNGIRAIGEGAYDFLTKPIDLQELKVLLKSACHVAALERDYHAQQQPGANDTFEGMLGCSPRMQAVFGSIRKVATTTAPVLILGESGTGKEMAALAIHRRSSRSDGPFIAINCGAIPETLLESELFGHEKGAFTGAHIQRKGRIESANNGTLFLDEIGELPLALQVKLLRFLQEQHLERVGGRETIEVNTRVIAATNTDLPKAMATGQFREDLFYRLAVVVIHLPRLRDRREDLQPLAQEFLRRFAEQNGKPGLAFDQGALRSLLRHSWPGNIRELENRVRRAAIMAEGRRVTAKDLELGGPASIATGTTLKDAREAAERDLIRQVLRRHSGKLSPAAAEMGISRPTLYELMDKLGIDRTENEVK
jgi:two-component system NtrC family response regulator